MPTTLAAGDIAFSAFQTANGTADGYQGDAFEFILLTAVTTGTVIYFTDRGYRTDVSGFDRSQLNEVVLRWTAPSDLPFATIVTWQHITHATNTAWAYVDPANGNVVAQSATFGGTANGTFASTGDSMIALVNPTFGAAATHFTGTAIAGIMSGDWAATYNGSSPSLSALPPGLTNGVNALSFTGAPDNGRYDETAAGSIEQGTAAQIRTSLNTLTNWVSQDTTFNPPGHTAGTFAAQNPTTLAAGDIAFSAYQSDNSGGDYNGDAFEFVLLVSVNAGTIIYFTDGGFQTDTSRFRTNEGLLRWTAQTDLAAGTIVTFRGNNASGAFTNTAEWTGLDPATGAVITTGTFSLAAAGDSIHAFQNAAFGGLNALNGTAIAALSIGGPDGFEATHTSISSNAETGLATGLTDGVNAVSFVGRANARYDETAAGSIEVGSVAQIRASLNNDTYWQTFLTQGSGPGSGVFNPGGHTAGTFQVVTVTPATVSIDDVSVTEGNAGTTNLTFTVTRTNNTGAFTLDYATANGTATAGSDYTATSGTITFTAGGSLTATITVTINGDTTFEANETLFVNLTNISNAGAATFSDAQGLGTITNDDAAPNVAPVVDLNGAGAGTSATLSYTENGAATAIAPAATVTDANSANFNGGTLTAAFTANGTAADQLTIQNQGNGAGQIGVSGANVSFGGTVIGTFTGGTNGTALVITFNNAAATPAAAEALNRAILFSNTSDNPSTLARTVTFTLVDGGGGADTGSATATVNVTAVDDAPVAVADTPSVNENATVAISVLANDTDVDGGPLNVATINGGAATVGNAVTLASGASVTLNANGTITYNPNGAFNYLVSAATAATTGALSATTDSFTYGLNGGSSTTVTVTVNGVAGAGDQLRGTSGPNTITGTTADDVFDLSQGGNDTVSGGNGNDSFFFGATFNASDRVDGGAGSNDQLGLRGDYTGGNALTLSGANLTGVETVALLAGFSYNVTALDDLLTTGQRMTIFGSGLGVGNNLTFNGSAETSGSFLVYGGLGTDLLTGGGGDDGFQFAAGRFNPATDIINGGGGSDQVALNAFTGTISGANLISVETVVLLSGSNTVTLADDWTPSGQSRTVFGSGLTQGATINGSAETNGNLALYGGSGNDTLTGGARNDMIFGGAGADTIRGGLGADMLRGDGGADTFVYGSAAESTSTTYDTLIGFDASVDKIDLPTAITAIDSAITVGTLSNGSFDSDLTAALAGLGANHAITFTANQGDMAGRVFLIADTNGIAGYQAGQDAVFELVTPVQPIIDPSPFI